MVAPCVIVPAMNLHEALKDARDRLAEAENQQAEIATNIGQYKDEIRGLELALRRHDEGALYGDLVPSKNGWNTIARTEAIQRLLRESDMPLGPAEIARMLAQRGRGDKDNPRYVSAALAYLKNKGVVESSGDSRWILTRTTTRETEERLETS
jgi:hypothetical protein